MVFVDVLFFILFAVIVIHAALRGFIEELTGAAWLVGGLLFAIAFFREGAAFIRARGLDGVRYLPEALAFFILFLIAFIAINIFGGMLRDIIERSGFVPLDRLLGVVFGICKGIVIIVVLIFVIRVQPLSDGNEILRESVIARLLAPASPAIEKTFDSAAKYFEI